ncbi:MAG: OmpH family outer membrane protein [Saprospiraceae bacterium]|nr:OmpH family outer membrane protein [Saprospiraceae bacterium]
MRILSISICFLFTSFLWSQKYGHVNYRMLLDSIQESKVINEQLNRYEKSLSDVGDKMLTKFQENFIKYKAGVEAGTLTATQRSQMESDLEVEQNAITNYQKSANESLEKRNTELLKPLLDKMTEKIKLFAAQEGYSMIFDSSLGLLFTIPTEDLLGKLVPFIDKK